VDNIKDADPDIPRLFIFLALFFLNHEYSMFAPLPKLLSSTLIIRTSFYINYPRKVVNLLLLV
jgi:hypothetical protein